MPLKIPYSWLQNFVPSLPAPDELAERLTAAGLEVETVEHIGADWQPDKLVVGEILSVSRHPHADRLCLAKIGWGKGRELTVVTGAGNVMAWLTAEEEASHERKQHPKVALALAGAMLVDPYVKEHKKQRLKPSSIRGVRSEGMLCSEKELGLSEAHEGIMLLPPAAEVGKPLVEVLGEAVLVFDIKGDFGHLLSVRGVAREAAALCNVPWESGYAGLPPCKPSATPPFVELRIEDPQWCSRYTAVAVEGVQMGDSPAWMQRRLLSCGMRPINAVVDITNYVMLETGQPLHAFDLKRLRGKTADGKPGIIVRRAKKAEQMHTLDDQLRTFDSEMLLIADHQGAIAVAGVMGGRHTEIQPDTTSVLLESAHFDFLNVRRTSQLLKIRSEAADRFGKRIDAAQTLDAALRCAQLMVEHCGGSIHPTCGDLYPRPAATTPIELNLNWLEKLLGERIPPADIQRILTALGFQVSGDNPLQVIPPSFRQDVSMPADLAEEVARIYGYHRFTPTRIAEAIPPPRDNRLLRCQEHIRDVLCSVGLDEVIAYSLIAPKQEQLLFNLQKPQAPPSHPSLQLKNPQTPERSHLRQTLLPGLLQIVERNLRFLPSVAVFELGAVFLPHPHHKKPQEPLKLAAALSGLRDEAHWQSKPPENFDFYDIKGVAQVLCSALHIPECTWKIGKHPALHPGQQAELLVNNHSLGHIGQLHPAAASAFNLENSPVCLLEIDVQTLSHLWKEDHPAQPLSSHPPVYEDLAFVVDQSLPAEELRQQIAKAGQPLLQQIHLFDCWQGGQLPPGKKSLAYALTYQSFERTLSDQDVAKVREKIVRQLQKSGAVLRD